MDLSLKYFSRLGDISMEMFLIQLLVIRGINAFGRNFGVDVAQDVWLMIAEYLAIIGLAYAINLIRNRVKL